MRKHILIAAAATLSLAAALLAADPATVTLPKPVTDGGKPLMQVLKERHTAREFKSDALPQAALSNLLWAAWGISRADNDHRTAPSAMNQQEIDIYVFTAEGVFLYDAKPHALKPVLSGDHRAAAGKQDFVATAPLSLVYVADQSKMGKTSSDADKAFYAAADCGFIAENVYLFCASEGLNCVVRGYVDRDAIAKTLNLHPEQKVLLGQTVGYPK
ncbi:MAG TPA: nitroreductase family protein [bacterium]|jgi:SagB-type dehydrogenase family enzyme